MAIESGLAWESFAIDDSGGTPREMDGRITQHSFSTTVAQQDITTINLSAMARLPLLADLQDSFTILFDDAANNSFDVVKTIGSASGPRTITRTHSGQTLASESNLTSVNWNRTQAGELTGAVSAALADGTVPTFT